MIGWYLSLGLACALAVFFYYLWVGACQRSDLNEGCYLLVCKHRDILLSARRELESSLADARIERDALRDELAKLKAPKARKRRAKKTFVPVERSGAFLMSHTSLTTDDIGRFVVMVDDKSSLVRVANDGEPAVGRVVSLHDNGTVFVAFPAAMPEIEA